MTIHAAGLTLSDVLDHLHPNVGPYVQRLSVVGPASSDDEYFRLRDGRWEMLGGWAPGKGPDLAAFIAANNSWARVRFSPNLSLVANASESAPFDVVTVRFPRAMVTPQRLPAPATDTPSGFGAYDDMATVRAAVGLHALEQKRINDEAVYDTASAEAVMARLRGLGDVRPSVVVNEGDAIVGCWRLDRFLHEHIAGHKLAPHGMPVPTTPLDGRFGRLHQRLALRLGGDCNAAARPAFIQIDAPETRRQDIKVGRQPWHNVTADLWHEGSFAIEDLEALAGGK